MTSSSLPDAAPANWVDRLAPPPLRPWLRLGRFDRPVGIWLLMLPAWMGVALAGAVHEERPDLRLFLLMAIGAAVMRAAGCAYNDIVDRDIDAKVARTALRPIPSGQISVKQAWGFTLACCGLGLVVLLQLKPYAIGLGFGSVFLVAAYPFMKRVTWWPQAWLGLTFNWGALLGFAAVTGTLALPALLLYAALIFWTLGYDTIYAIQDIEDDALAGVKSSARRLGSNTPGGVGLFYALTVLLAVASVLVGGLSLFALVGVTGFGLLLKRQITKIRMDDPVLALGLFKSNSLAGLVLVIGLALGSLTFVRF